MENHEGERAGFVSPDPRVPKDRWYEQTIWARALVWFQRLSPLMTILFLTFVAFGFQFRSPAAWFEKLENKIQQVEDRAQVLEVRVAEKERLDEAQRQVLLSRINILIRFKCLELAPRERITQDICDAQTPWPTSDNINGRP